MKKWAVCVLVLMLVLAVCMPVQAAQDAGAGSPAPGSSDMPAQTGVPRGALQSIVVGVILIVACVVSAWRDKNR